MTMTINQAKLELRILGRGYESGSIDVDTWCNGVHHVIQAFQSGRDARAAYASALAAPAPPAPTDSPRSVAGQVVVPVALTNAVHSHSTRGHAS